MKVTKAKTKWKADAIRKFKQTIQAEYYRLRNMGLGHTLALAGAVDKCFQEHP